MIPFWHCPPVLIGALPWLGIVFRRFLIRLLRLARLTGRFAYRTAKLVILDGLGRDFIHVVATILGPAGLFLGIVIAALALVLRLLFPIGKGRPPWPFVRQ
jgi:hypothetical protein